MRGQRNQIRCGRISRPDGAFTVMRQPIKVCFPFTGDTVGGSHISALLLIQNLDRTRFEPIVVLHENNGALSLLLKEKGVPYQYLPLLGYLRSDFRFWPKNFWLLVGQSTKLIRFLRRQEVQIVHSNDSRIRLTWLLPTWLAGVYSVWHQRLPVRKRILDTFAFLLVDRIIGVSEFIVESVRTRVPARKITVIENPFTETGDLDTVSAYRESLLKEFDAGADASIVGFFANLHPRKRPEIFAQTALELIRRSQHTVVFPMFGRMYGEYASEFERQIKTLGLAQQVRVLGFKSPVEPWLAACDVLLAPAVDEGFGRTLVEAMFVGTPVVAAASGGHLEILSDGETGFLVEPDDPEAFADRVIKLLENPSLVQKIVGRAKRNARSRFGIENHVQQVSSVYSELLGLD